MAHFTSYFYFYFFYFFLNFYIFNLIIHVSSTDKSTWHGNPSGMPFGGRNFGVVPRGCHLGEG